MTLGDHVGGGPAGCAGAVGCWRFLVRTASNCRTVSIPQTTKHAKQNSCTNAMHANSIYGIDVYRVFKQELSYRKQIARQLHTQYVEGIYDNPVTLKYKLRVTQDH